MDVNDIISEMQDHGFQGTNSSRLLSFVNQAYQEFCSTPYPFLEQMTTFTQSGATAQVTAIPSNPTVATLRTVKSLVDLTNDIPLRPSREETLVKSFASDLTESGTARFYYFVGRNLFTYPVNPAPVSMNSIYMIKPVNLDLTTNTTPIIPDEFRGLLVPRALSMAFAMNDDTDIGTYFRQDYKDRLALAQEALWMRQYDRPQTVEDVMGDPTIYGWGGDY